jgi:hypothetical protein
MVRVLQGSTGEAFEDVQRVLIEFDAMLGRLLASGIAT